jgi:hypothetical protein
LKRDLHVAEVDEAYTQHFPHAETYISLYPVDKREKEADDGKNDYTPLKQRGLLHTERPPIWSEVEQALKEGPSALRELRERRSSGGEEETKPQRRENKPKAQANVGKPVAKTQPKQQTFKDKSTSNNKDDSGATMNRRERRRLMHQNKQTVVKSDDDDSDGGGFFEED